MRIRLRARRRLRLLLPCLLALAAPPVQFFPNRGSDSDSSPTYGGSFGVALPLQSMPWRWEESFALPDWTARIELEGLGGRDYELQTRGADAYLSEVTSWTLMNNFWMDVPLDAPIARLFGRIPVLDPLGFNLGGGVGLAANDVSTTDNVSRGGKTAYGFAWQVGAGFDYAFTKRVTFGIGYRYLDLGEVDFGLRIGETPIGDFSLDLTAHEIATSLRVEFHSFAPGR
jgi:hypothetical protein